MCSERMSGNKAAELQIQMRQNAEDLQSFMRELDGWEDEIKKKDQQLRAGNTSETPVNSDSESKSERFGSVFAQEFSSFQKTLPPVRNTDYKKTKKRAKRPRDPAPPIGSYDYQAWDKFDVVIRF